MTIDSSESSRDGTPTLFTEPGCRFCAPAKTLLERRVVDFVEVDVSTDRESRAAIVAMSGRATLPQLFFGGKFVGGFDELIALDRAGELTGALRG